MPTRRAVALALSLAPLAVTTAAASTPDPVFTAIEAHRAAVACIDAFFANNPEDDIPDDLSDAETDRLIKLLAMTPATTAGCAAMLRYIETEADRGDNGDQLFSSYYEPVSEPAATLLSRLADVIERQAANARPTTVSIARS